MSTGAPGDDFRVLPPEHMWKLARVIIQSWFAPMMRLRVYGQDRIPRGAAVIASNHIAGDDPIVLGMACPRSIRYMAKIELWRVPVLRHVIPHTGAFPVDRGNADRETITNARAVLRSGNLLGIFVEGTRQTNDEIGAARTGVAMCAVPGERRDHPRLHHRNRPARAQSVPPRGGGVGDADRRVWRRKGREGVPCGSSGSRGRAARVARVPLRRATGRVPTRRRAACSRSTVEVPA